MGLIRYMAVISVGSIRILTGRGLCTRLIIAPTVFGQPALLYSAANLVQ